MTKRVVKKRITLRSKKPLVKFKRKSVPVPNYFAVGKNYTSGEIIADLLRREGTRNDALALVAETLASLGITGEEVAHWQKQPGICFDCNDTDKRVNSEWESKAKGFPDSPFEIVGGYYTKEGNPL